MLETAFTDIGTVMAFVIPAILTLAIALVGLGWGWRKFQRYVSGRKF